ncbi:MAG TPA: hypothetical protein ENK57_25550 [Polyangiaceae bacterium]|nr:hypothetical protein [Polyangiaceae bacterium]
MAQRGSKEFRGDCMEEAKVTYTSFESTVKQMRLVSRQARLALAAACGQRVVPVFDEYWVEDHTPMARRAVEYAWAIACDELRGDTDLRQYQVELLDFIECYQRKRTRILASSVTAIVQTITAAAEENAALAVARACGAARDVASSVDVIVDGHRQTRRDDWGRGQREERDWQEAALGVVAQGGEISREMFRDCGPMPPEWWYRYQAAPEHV